MAGARGRASHDRSAVRSITEAHCIVATHYPLPLLPTLYFLLPSFAISPYDNTVHDMSCITCGMFGVKRAETNHNYLICNKL